MARQDEHDSAPFGRCESALKAEIFVVKAAQKNQPFNVDAFLATANGGRTIAKYRKGQKVFQQGEPADSVFYLQEGEVKVCVISEQGKEAVVPSIRREISSARAA